MSAVPRHIDRPIRRLAAAVLSIACLLAGAALPVAARVAPSDDMPDLDRTGVVVPWEDFKKILEEIRHRPPPVVPQPPPVDFALSACEVVARVTADEQQAFVSMSVSLQVLNPDRWVEVPVIAEGVALSRFEIDGRAASVYRKGGYHRIAVRGEGHYELRIEYLAAVRDDRGSHSTSLRFIQAPVIALDLTVPRKQLSFRLDGAVVRSTERSNGSTRVLAAFQQARDVSVTWFKEAELDEKETKLLGELRTLLSVGEGALRGTTHAALTIHGKGVDRFRVGLPEDLTILEVHAQGLDDWSVGTAGDDLPGAGRVLTVRLNHLAQGGYSFRFVFERALGDTTAKTSIPDLVLFDAIRDKGYYAVAAATNVEINPVGELRNATPVDPTELPAELAGSPDRPILYGFKYLQHPVQAELSIVRHEDLAVKRTIVESGHLFTYVSPEGKRITSACYRVKNNRKQYLEVTLPPGGQGWAAYVGGRPVKAARTKEGKILIPLRRAAVDAAGEPVAFDVELVYYQREAFGTWGRQHLVGPGLDVDALEVQWHVFLPRDKRYSGFGGNLRPDVDLNRVVYLEATAYNLEATDDREALRRSGLAGEDLAGLDRGALADLLLGGVDAPAPAPEESEKKQKRERLEQRLDRIKSRAEREADEPARPAPSQALSNVGGRIDPGTGARVAGLLPVRFDIPVDGLRLSFTGRLLTTPEPPELSVHYRPAAWELSSAAVFAAAAVLGWILLWLVAARGLRVSTRLAALPLAALLAALPLLEPARRGAFTLGLVLALAAFVAPRVWSRSREAVAATLLLVVLGAWTSSSRAGESATPPGPRMPDLGATEVTLSWADFKSIVEATYAPPPVVPAPPAEAFLRSAEYRGRLAPGILDLDGRLTLEVLKDGWARLPLTTEATVIGFEGGGALLHRNGAGLEILARGPATYTLRLQLAFHAGDRPGENRVAVRLPDAPRNLVDLTTDPALRDVGVETGLGYDARNDHVYVSLAGGALGLKYTLPFTQVEEAAGEEVQLDPRVQVAAYQMLNLGDGVTSGVLIHDYDVRVAEVSHFDIDLPDDVVLFDCRAAGLESWKILRRDGQRYLRVKLLAPTDGSVRVVLSFEGTYDAGEGRVQAPRFVPLDVERESGFIAVSADGAEVDLRLSGNLLPADVSELPRDVAAMGGNLIGVCKYSGPPDAATVAVTEHEDAAVLTAIVERLNATAALLENGTEATWIELTVRNNRKQFLRFTLSEPDVEVWSLLLDGQPAKPKRTGDDVLIPLPRGNGETAATISLVLLRKGAAVRAFGRLQPTLPTFDVPVSEALWTVYLPPGRKYRAGGGEFRPVLVTDPLSAVAGPAVATKVLAERAYSDAVSGAAAEAQLRQEDEVGRHLVQKGAGRKGSLPVRITIPGGVLQLPKVTVSRMLIVGNEPNTFPIRVYPAWFSAALRGLQPVLLLVAATLLGLSIAGVLGRAALAWGGLVGLLGLWPFGGVHPVIALLLLAVLTASIRIAVPKLRRIG